MESVPQPIGRHVKGLTGSSYEDFETWPTPDQGALEGDCLARYLNRKKSVRMYLSGCTEGAIRQECGFGLKQVYRLITERCLQPHKDGLIYGCRGLIPNRRIRPYVRKRPVKVDGYGCGAVGAMSISLALNPVLKKSFDKRILSSPHPDELGATKRPRQSHWKWFLDELRSLGYEIRGEWPFNTKSNGYSTICRYIDQVFAANPKKAVRATGGPDMERKLASGDGVDRPVQDLFQRVEMDAHHIDGRFCVMMPQVTGGYLPKIIPRIWVIVIIEVVSRAVLGYFLSMGREVSKEDVLRTIKKALTRSQLRKLSFSNVAYLDGAGMPSGVSDRFVGVCWSETSVDGALAETCSHVEQVLTNVVGANLISPKSGGFSSRRSKDDRPFIETFFRKLASCGFQRMSNTTGGSPKGKQGRNPETVALTSQFQLEYAEELLDVLVANYNATPHTSLGYRSPLAYLDFISSRPGQELRYADAELVQQMLSYRKKCPVKGGLAQGRRPFVNFEGARYTNETLGQRFDLVGKYIWVINHHEDDARVALASTVDEGQHLGVLRAAPPWHKLPHSLRVRRAINSAVRARMFFIASGADAVETFLDFAESQADGKLPVHPAYLEARRILVQQAELAIGRSLLESALENAKESAAETSKTEHSEAGPATAQDKKDPGSQKPSHTLPPRRKAASD